IRVDKVAAFAIVINTLQIAAILALVLLVFFTDLEKQSQGFVEYMVVIAGVVVVVGAYMDIQHARYTLRMHEQAKALEAAYGQLESLNVVLRAQRHDFMNHLQVVFSLIEMEDYREAVDYIQKVYGDIQSVSRSLRTGNPSINALLKVKFAECERRGIEVDAKITSPWNNLPIQGWEMCRVLGNLIDNAMDAMAEVKHPKLTLQLREELGSYRFRIINNGPQIPASVAERIFQSGFTTKRTGQGMGLHIVRSILREAGGDIAVQSGPEETAFEGWLPRGALDGDAES
ncbi:MAG TPA: Spo0B domain-containing protein, partial [Clostridia bacterium]|nr:Spo0B domain-containing protein [Clostridia bacterium]